MIDPIAFIDTNRYLAFYSFHDDELEELNKLAEVLRLNRATLLITDQVKQEFRRNRDAAVANALAEIKRRKVGGFPRLAHHYTEYETLRTHLAEYEKARRDLIDRVKQDAAARTLKADETIAGLFEQATLLEVSDDTLARARLRAELGNPPGKPGSLGDAVNWEALLEGVPEDKDLHFVTGDGDYGSPLDGVPFNTYLMDEWSESKQGVLHPYEYLSEFFAASFPEIQLAAEAEDVFRDQEKQERIAALGRSGTFAATHHNIAQLERYQHFTDDQANELLRGAMGNNQVWGIAGDQDVRAFLERIVDGRKERLDTESVAQLDDHLARADEWEAQMKAKKAK